MTGIKWKPIEISWIQRPRPVTGHLRISWFPLKVPWSLPCTKTQVFPALGLVDPRPRQSPKFQKRMPQIEKKQSTYRALKPKKQSLPCICKNPGIKKSSVSLSAQPTEPKLLRSEVQWHVQRNQFNCKWTWNLRNVQDSYLSSDARGWTAWKQIFPGDMLSSIEQMYHQ